jgi:poly-gamma-glutamate synthesis protein (capsule biosynthesis protein)
MRLALAGDTMLGRGVAERLAESPTPRLFAPEVADVIGEADLFLLNLECAISDRGQRWPSRTKPFYFRAPPIAATVLKDLGVDCVTLANNHALDYGADALLDTFRHLQDAGVAWAGAGADESSARAPLIVERAGSRVGIVAVTDHPAEYAAGPWQPGVAFADLRREVPQWLLDTIGALTTDTVVVTPHWGPNMTAEPVRHVRAAATALLEAGATLVAGHSAHVFHGVRPGLLYDLGDFVDDYAVDPELRNDRGLLFLVTVDGRRLVRVEAVPLALDYCYTRLADAEEARWVTTRFRRACRRLGTEVTERGRRVLVEWEAA